MGKIDQAPSSRRCRTRSRTRFSRNIRRRSRRLRREGRIARLVKIARSSTSRRRARIPRPLKDEAPSIGGCGTLGMRSRLRSTSAFASAYSEFNGRFVLQRVEVFGLAAEKVEDGRSLNKPRNSPSRTKRAEIGANSDEKIASGFGVLQRLDDGPASILPMAPPARRIRRRRLQRDHLLLECGRGRLPVLVFG